MNTEAPNPRKGTATSISLVAAMGKGWVIGNRGELPWELPADMRYFMELTMGKTLVMGRRTYQSIGKALPGRENLVLSRDRAFKAPGCQVYHSLEELLKEQKEKELFVIGGEEVYRLFLPLASRLYLTVIEQEFQGDRHFPRFTDEDWELVSWKGGTVDSENRYPHSFLVYEKKM